MFRRTDDLRITQTRPLIPPAILLEEIPISERPSNIASDTRAAIGTVLHAHHPPPAALECANRLQPLAVRYARELVVVMRSYFEKPRTSIGWKGLINDPDLDESFHINKGRRLARRLLLGVNALRA